MCATAGSYESSEEFKAGKTDQGLNVLCVEKRGCMFVPYRYDQQNVSAHENQERF
jgi:hypothetical protein